MMPSNSAGPRNQQLLDPTWSVPVNVSSSSGRAVNPVAIPGEPDTVHLLWEEHGRVCYAVRRGGQWAAPRSVATGQRPSAGLSADGVLHVVFSNDFAGRTNVFYVHLTGDVWSLPRLVSKTPGNSTFPSLAVDRTGVVHAVWADTSPGFSLIYHGWLQGSWLNEPLSNARGAAPQLALDGAADLLHLAYQGSSISGAQREIFHMQGCTYEWSLPENLSMSPGQESLGATIACAPDGTVHLAWQEQVANQAHIRTINGRQGAWHPSQPVSDLAVDGREPRLAITQARLLNLVWRTGDTLLYARRELPAGAWLAARSLVLNPGGLDGLTLAGAAGGELHLGWSGWESSSQRAVFHSEHGPWFRPKVFVPGVLVGQR
jgi:hypothetical protein